MIVKFKTLNEKGLPALLTKLELTPETTIGQIRDKLAPSLIKCEPSQLKFTLPKKPLTDTVTIRSLNLTEKDSIIVSYPKPSTTSKEAKNDNSQQQPANKPPPAVPITTPGTEAIPIGGNNIEPKEERVKKYYQLKLPLNDRELYSNIDKVIKRGLTIPDFEKYLLTGELPLEMNIPYMPNSTPESSDEAAETWLFGIETNMLIKTPQLLENFVQREEKKLKTQEERDFFRKNVTQIFLHPRNLDSSKFDVHGIAYRNIEKIPDSKFLSLYYDAHHAYIDELLVETNKIANENRLKSKTIEVVNTLNEFYSDPEDIAAVRRLAAVSTKLNIYQVSKIYKSTYYNGRYNEMEALNQIMRINHDPNY